jgi:TPR repeat protein
MATRAQPRFGRPCPALAANRPNNIAVLGALLAFGLVGQAIAGPLDNAAAARRNGDYSRAEQVLGPLAERGDVHAQYDLGSLYADPGPRQDVPKAAAWFRKAADQGYAPAQATLGGMYAMGGGVAADPSQAALWFRRAADQSDAEGEAGLAVCYARGLGVPQSDVQAFFWFKKAADHGLMVAQANVALMYQSGRGVARDDTQALMWFDLAAGHVLPDSIEGAALAMKARDALGARMTTAEVEEAKRLAAAWVAGHPAPRAQ